jgi:hypothetical protein
MPVKLNVEVEDAEQGELQALIGAAGELYPRELRRALALPSVRDEVEGRPNRRDLYDAVDGEGLAELAEVERVSGFDVRGDEHTGYFVTFAVIDSSSGVSRGFFPYDEVPKLADRETDAVERAPSGDASGAGPAPVPFDGYDDANQDTVIAYLEEAGRTADEVAAVKAYEAEHKDRVKVREFVPAAS